MGGSPKKRDKTSFKILGRASLKFWWPPIWEEEV
ncbi:UNVERIFIED_CONTAM: hypothetical protein GTU68_025620 [Idotea baltica]|nr:hypothetical protein [Idotea baltica]